MRTVFFLKRFKTYIMLLVLPMTVISAYSLYHSIRQSHENIETRNWNLLYQIQNQMDSMYETIHIIDSFLSSSPAINDTIQDAFLDDTLTSANVDQMQTVALFLRSILNSNVYAHSAYLYFDNEFGRYIAASNGLSYIRSYSDYHWLKNYLDAEQDFWCETDNIPMYSHNNPLPVITMYQKLYSPYSTSLPRGVLVTHYSLDSITEYINGLNLYPNQAILFLQENGTILYQSDSSDYSDILPEIKKSLTLDDYSDLKIRYQDKMYVASVIRSSEENCYYLSLVPNRELYASSWSLSTVFLTVLILMMLLTGYLSMRSARLDYAQLQSIIRIFSDATSYSAIKEEPVNKNDPYQVILHDVINLFVKQHYLQLQITNKQYEMQLLELNSLQHQINPHFLFNTLNMIYWEAIHFTNQPNACSSMISDLSDIMAYSLTDAQNKVPVAKELEYLRHYTRIQETRYKDRLTICWEIDEEVLEYGIIKMIFQPLIENAIDHGIKKLTRKGIIKIRVHFHPDRIQIHILDNGVGIAADQLALLQEKLKQPRDSIKHIGLLNTNRRLILAYGEASAIRIISRQNIGTVIAFQIPLEKLESS